MEKQSFAQSKEKNEWDKLVLMGLFSVLVALFPIYVFPGYNPWLYAPLAVLGTAIATFRGNMFLGFAMAVALNLLTYSVLTDLLHDTKNAEEIIVTILRKVTYGALLGIFLGQLFETFKAKY